MTDTARLDATVDRETVFGGRYTPAMLATIGTGKFA